ncbi:hypothetical protein A9976_10355 [Delftia sp. UME58]|nr:hypothetical protein [Delftia sp. UME58]
MQLGRGGGRSPPRPHTSRAPWALHPGEAVRHGALADALMKLPPLGVLRSGAEKPDEEALLPAQQLAELKAEG